MSTELLGDGDSPDEVWAREVTEREREIIEPLYERGLTWHRCYACKRAMTNRPSHQHMLTGKTLCWDCELEWRGFSREAT